jgi:acyl-CoA thioester hydrolase
MLEINHLSEFKVRDYECDLQGIVNNANYFHYLEQSRHEFLQSHGIDFKLAHDMGLDLVVAKAEVDFIKPLLPSDKFTVYLEFSREGRLRYIFSQKIFRCKNLEAEISEESVISRSLEDFSQADLILSARITCACIDRNRSKPCKFEWLEKILAGRAEGNCFTA